MDGYKRGMLARSKAGHDMGQVYLIMDVEDAYVYLADGKARTLDKQKKKNKKHVQLICRQYDVAQIDETRVKRILKEFNKEKEKQEEI